METYLQASSESSSGSTSIPKRENCLEQTSSESEGAFKTKIKTIKSANVDTTVRNAVIVRCANKSYKSGTQVLNQLNMTVPCGSIYGLLGSSGCGKTTLLSCIVGQRKLDHGRGDISIFGSEPGTKGIEVPGRNVGYMPQDISLYLEFSIKETFTYFGTLSGLSTEQINGRTTFLVKLLDLPRKSRYVGTLSGGQQRRVSLAVALIHDPELLILDEPVSKISIIDSWAGPTYATQNLVQNSKRTTVILTTHYIEECRQADNIGIMRNGRLLMERQTSDLFTEHGTTNLEKIVLSISRKDHVTTLNAKEFTQQNMKNSKWFRYRKNKCIIDNRTVSHKNANEVLHQDLALMMNWPDATLKDFYVRIRALTGKNFVILLRNPLLLFFVILIAAVLNIVTCTALGQEPNGLPIGLVNKLDYLTLCPNISKIQGECNVDSLSCHYLINIPKDSLQLKFFENEADAIQSTQDGNTWGYILFPENFTEKLFERVVSGALVDESTINASQITVRLDETSKHISGTIKKVLYDAYEKFTKTFLTDCGFDSRQVNSPLMYDQPIFGTHDTNFREFLAPGGIPGLLFFFPIITTSIRYIKEKKSGVMDCSLVSGVQTWEIMVAYSISEFFVLLTQSLINYLVLTQLFEIHILGNDLIVIIMYILGAYGGVSMGFLLGSICAEEIQAAMIAMVAFFPNLLLSGLIWPVEGMPLILQKISQVLPCTLSAQALRNITSRGWEFTHPNVWPGFAVLVAYIIGYFILTIIFHKIIKN